MFRPPRPQIGQRGNAVFTGTSVHSGTAAMAVVHTGERTEFASVAAATRRSLETVFARGFCRFGYLMTTFAGVRLTIRNWMPCSLDAGQRGTHRFPCLRN